MKSFLEACIWFFRIEVKEKDGNKWKTHTIVGEKALPYLMNDIDTKLKKEAVTRDDISLFEVLDFLIPAASRQRIQTLIEGVNIKIGASAGSRSSQAKRSAPSSAADKSKKAKKKESAVEAAMNMFTA